MTYALVILVALVAALMQGTVSPLFPLGGAVADLGLVAILAIALASGPRPAMVALPVVAVVLAFTGSHAPGLYFIAYLPLLPLVYLVEEGPVPTGNFLRFGLPVLATGLWARLVFASAAFVNGADVPPRALMFDVLLPGMVFDAIFFAIVFVPFRFAGRTGRTMALRRTGWNLG